MNDKKYKFFLISFFVILALPLLTSPAWFHPAAWGKVIVFRIIISGLIFLFIYQLLFEKTLCKKSAIASFLYRDKNKVFWPLGLLIALWAVFLLATIFSQDPYYSFFGDPQRTGGFLNFSLYIIFAILAFLIIKKEHWQKVWDFCLIIGVLASIMATLQYFQVFKEYLIPHEENPSATFGNSMFLAIYLLLLVFLALSFGLREKKRLKKIFYFSIIPLFIFVILITKTRAVYLGLLLGGLYFFLAYPKKIPWLKIATGIAIVIAVTAVYFVNTQDQLPEFVENNRILKAITSRLSLELLVRESRFSTWQVAFNAIKEKPILGWGPENFSIAFDKHYDPALPELPLLWWDKAHNFIFDIAVTAGVPGLIIYLSLFAALFWQLQKVKRKNPDDKLIYHGIQACFIAYLTANFFSFDSFSTYLISFLLIGYCLSLLKPAEARPLQMCRGRASVNSALWKSGIALGLLCILIWFAWSFNLKPLLINRQINLANYNSKNNQCEKAVQRMDYILSSHSNIDSFVRIKYLDIIKDCLEQNIETKNALVPKAVSVLRELKKIKPNYTRTWIVLGNYLNILIANSKASKIENVEELIKEANACFQRAHELSPKREEVFLGWIQTDLLSEKYQSAKEKAEQCIDLNPNLAYCWWQKALANIFLEEFEQSDQNIKIAVEKGYNPISKKSLIQLREAYLKVLERIENKNKELYIECYQRLADIYEKLITHVDQENFQYHASLSYAYKTLGEYEKAREQTLKVVKLSPESVEIAKEFLKSILDLDNNRFQYHLYLARAYYIVQDFEQAEQQGLAAWQYSIPKDYSRTQANDFLRNLYFHLAKLDFEKGEYKQAKQKALTAWQYSQELTQPRAEIDAFLESLPK